MKTTLTIVCTISAMCVVGAVQKPSARKTSISESELRALATAAPTAKNAGQLYSVAMATTNNVERRQELLKAAAACLIACGKNDVYKNHVKGKLQGVVGFENELKDDCKQCSGTGTKERRCSECNGNGQCSRCKGAGQTTHVGFDRNNTVKTCGKCNGDRRCSKCGGEGSKKEKCVTCAGTGKAFSEAVAARVFRESCNAIADSMKFAYESTNGMSLSEKGKATGAVNASVECNRGLSHENSCFSASELQALAESIPDVRSGGKLYSAAMATTNNIERQKYLKAAAACLVACGKNDVYEKRVKGKLINAAEFESMVKEGCNQCSGSGMKKQRCNDCNGNGRCSRCTAGFRQSATCSKCNSSGCCPKCSGKGYKEEKCVTCAGTGKVFNTANATRFFRDSCNVIADGKEGGSVQTDNMLGQLENLKQRRYSLREVVSVGKAMLSTLKIPREAISHTPFYCRGSDNGLELREKVRATVKSAQTLLSDIDANEVEISKGEFEPADYIEFWHKDTTKICKQRLFDEIWEKALYSPHLLHDANNNPLSKVLLSKVPDNIVFVVNDVSLVELRRGGRVYCVKLTPLVFGEKNRMLGMVWTGRECQTKRYIELAEKAGFLARGTRGAVRLLVPTSSGNESVEEWEKGDTVISKGWMNKWTITNAVRTYDDGRKKEIREIEMSGEIVRAFRDWEEMTLNVSP